MSIIDYKIVISDITYDLSELFDSYSARTKASTTNFK